MTKPQSPTSRRKYNGLITVGLFAGLLVAIDSYLGFNPVTFTLSLLSLAGCFVSVLVVLQVMKKGNALTRMFCDTVGRFNCNAVLNSKAAKVSKDITLGDVGLVYFASQFLFLFIGVKGSEASPALFLFVLPSSLAWLITFWSIWYQWRVVRGWCKMCLAIAAIIWLQEGLTVYSLAGLYERNPGIVDDSFYRLMTSWSFLTLLSSAWFFVKPLIMRVEEGTEARQQIRQWRRNATVFSALLKRQPKVDATVWEDDLVLGNRRGDATFQFIIAVNPFCPGCAIEYSILSDLLRAHPNDITLIIRFGIHPHKPEADQNMAAQAILSAYFNAADGSLQKQVVDDWYKPIDQQEWRRKYYTGDHRYPELLQRYIDWFVESKIERVPDLLINGQRLPDGFYPDGLKVLIPKLIKRKNNVVPTTEP